MHNEPNGLGRQIVTRHTLHPAFVPLSLYLDWLRLCIAVSAVSVPLVLSGCGLVHDIRAECDGIHQPGYC